MWVIPAAPTSDLEGVGDVGSGLVERLLGTLRAYQPDSAVKKNGGGP